MRTLITFLFALPFLFFHQEVFAQPQFGISAGYISSVPNEGPDFNGPLHENYKACDGYSLALSYRGRKFPKFNAGYELLYTNKSYKDESLFAGLGTQRYFDTKITLRHMSFSPFVEYSIGQKVRLNMGAGIALGLLLGQSKKGTITIIHGGQESTETYSGHNETDKLKADIRAALRLGFEFPLSNQISLALEQTFSYGFSEIKTKDLLIQAGLQYQMVVIKEQ